MDNSRIKEVESIMKLTGILRNCASKDHFSSSKMVETYNISAAYFAVAVKLGYMDTKGPNRQTRWIHEEAPNNDIAQRIHNATKNYYVKNSSKKRKNTPKKPTATVITEASAIKFLKSLGNYRIIRTVEQEV
jgi:hypothetical protein